MAIEKTVKKADGTGKGAYGRFACKRIMAIALLFAVVVLGSVVIGGLSDEGTSAAGEYTISGMTGTGYTLTPGEGLDPNAVDAGTDFTFTLAINAGYIGTPVVKAGSTTLTATEGVYTIENVSANVTITVTGLVRGFVIDGLAYTIISDTDSLKTVSVKADSSFSLDANGALIIPDTVENDTKTYKVVTIEEQAFKNKSEIKTITFGSNVTRINNHAFDYCTGLTSVTLPAQIEWLGYYIFDYCKNLTRIDYDCVNADTTFHSWNYNIVNNKYTFNNNQATAYTVEIGAGVQSIPVRCFNYKATGASYLLEEDSVLQTVNDYAFASGGTIKFDLPSSLQTIGEQAFSYTTFNGASGNKQVVFSSELQTISINSFTSVTVNKLTVQTNATQNKIGIQAKSVEFSGNAQRITGNYVSTYLESLTIGSSVTTIDSDVFSTAINLTSITLVSNTNFGWDEAGVLYELNGSGDKVTLLRSVVALDLSTIPNTVTTIGPAAFYGITFEDLDIGSNIASIGNNAFKNAVIEGQLTLSFTSLSVGTDVFSGARISELDVGTQNVPANMFKGSVITAMEFTADSITIGNNAFQNARIGSVSNTASIVSYGNYSFNASTLNEIAFPATGNVTIGKEAFSGTQLMGVTITSAVTSVGQNAFYNIPYLSEIVLIPDIGSMTIGNNAFETLYSTDESAYSMSVVKLVKEQKVALAGDELTAFKTYAPTTAINTGSQVPGDTSVTDGKINWTYTASDRRLVLKKGTTGIMNSSTPITWEAYKKFAKIVVIDNDITTTTAAAMDNFIVCEEFTVGTNVNTFYGARNMYNLKTINWLATGCSSVPADAFDNCGNKGTGVSVNFSGAITNIPQSFLNSTTTMNVVSITMDLTANVTFGTAAFHHTQNVSYFEFNCTGTVADNNGYSRIDNLGANVDNLEIKFGANVNGIPANMQDMFHRCQKVTFGGATTAVLGNGLMNNTTLQTVVLPAGCTTINQGAFEGCTSLTTINLGNVTTIGASAFYNCVSLSNVDLSSAVTIQIYAFQRTQESINPLGSVVSLEHATFIGERAFKDSGLSGAVDTALNCDIRSEAFYGCAVTSFTVNSTNTIGASVFSGMTSESFEIVLKTVAYTSSFQNNSTVSAVVIHEEYQLSGIGGNPESVYDLKSTMFKGCSNLRTLTISGGAEREHKVIIGQSSFEDCTQLAVINGMGGISTIKQDAFKGCISLFLGQESVTFSNITLGDSAFFGAITGTRSIAVVIDNCSFTDNSSAAQFYNCNITSLTYSGPANFSIYRLMDGCGVDYDLIINGTNIPNVAYPSDYPENKKTVRSVVIGETVTGGSDSSFKYCSRLASITFNATAFAKDYTASTTPFESIYDGDIAFAIGEGVTKIPAYFFYGTSIKGNISIPADATVGIFAFANCSNLRTDGVCTLTIGSGASVGHNAFDGSAITSVTAGTGATIEYQAFKGCTALTTATISDVALLGASAFDGCSGLETASITGDFTRLQNFVFNDCSSLSAFTIPATVTEIGMGAFQGCTSLQSITLPQNLVTIGASAFNRCPFTTITIPGSVTTINDQAFSACAGLATLTFDDGVEDLVIGQKAFYNTAISELNLPERTTTIGANAFSGPSNGIPITSLVIPAGVTSIGSNAFANTKQLTRVMIMGNEITSANEGFKYAGDVDNGFTLVLSSTISTVPAGMFKGSKVSVIQVGDGSITIGDSSFEGCSMLTAIPTTFKNIGSSSFEGCVLIESLVFLNGTVIGYESFDGCIGLRVIRTEGTVSIGTRAFNGCTGLQTVVLSGGTTFSDPGSSYYPFTYNDGVPADLWAFNDTEDGALDDDAEIKGRSYSRVGDTYVLKECYTVSFDVMGLADPIDPQVMSGTTKATCPTEGTTLPGLNIYCYSFDGKWYTDHVGGTEWDFDDDVTGNMVLIAGITPNTYRVEFSGCGGEPGSTDVEITYGTPVGSITGIPAQTMTGYTFLGYFTSDEGGTKVVNADCSVIANVPGWTENGKWSKSDTQQSLYAQFSANSYVITIKKDGATLGSATVVFRDTHISWVNKPALTGYSIEGLYVEDTYSEVQKIIDPDGNIMPSILGWTDNTGAWQKAEGAVVELRWTPVRTHIVFDKNEGTMNGSATAYYDDGELHSVVAVEREGHVLLGYYTLAEDGVKVVNADGTLVHDVDDYTTADGKWSRYDGEEVRLYAQWRLVHYTIAFDANGGTGDAPAPQDGYYGQEVILTANVFTRENYGFIKWNTDAGGAGQDYADGAHVTDLSTTDGATVTLYAQWQGNQYTITFNGNGNTSGLMDVQTARYGEQVNLNQHAYSKTGYKFREWNTAEGGTGASYGDKAQVSDLGSITLFAQWDPITYYVSFSQNYIGGAHSMDDQTLTYDVAENLSANIYVREGYTFAGWNSDYEGNGISYTDQQEVINLVHTDGASYFLFAMWTPNTTTVTLKPNGGTGDDVVVTATFGQALPFFTKPTMTGYNLAGFFTAVEGGDKVINADGTLVQGDVDDHVDDGMWACLSNTVTLHAQWEKKTTRVTIDANGGSTSISQVTFTYETSLQGGLSGADPVRTGYNWSGYYTQREGGILIASEGANFESDVDEYVSEGLWIYEGAELTLFIHWTPRQTQLVLNFNDGTDGYRTTNATYDGGVDAFEPVTRTGYTLLGYTDVKDGDNMVLDASGSLVQNCGDMVVDGKWKQATSMVPLYAKWQVNMHNVIFNGHGATSGTMANQQFAYDGMVTLANNAFTRTGYTFLHWTETENDSAIYYSNGSQVGFNRDEDVTLYAQWAPNTYHVTIDANGGTGSYGFDVTYGQRPELTDFYSQFSRTGYDIFWIVTEQGTSGTPIIEFPVEHGVRTCVMNGNVEDYTNFNVEWIHADDATFYVDWTNHRYEGTLSSNGLGTDGSFNVLYLFTTVGVDAPTREGYDVEGYYTGQGGTGDLVMTYADSTFTLRPNLAGLTNVDGQWINTDGNVTIYAKWVPKTYNLTLVAGDGGTDGEATVVFGDDHFTITRQPVKAHYHVYAYSANQGVAGPDGVFNCNDGEYVKNLKWSKAADSNLLVNWNPDEYTVELRVNGGDSDDREITMAYNTSVSTLHLGYPTKFGYFFTGYYSEPEGGIIVLKGSNTGVIYNAEGWVLGGNWIRDTESQILYAHWTPDSAALNLYDENGDTGCSRSIKFDGTSMEHGSVPKRTGHEIEGYYLDQGYQTKIINADLSVVPGINGYSDANGKWKADPNPEGGYYVLYVKWVPTTSSITLDKNGGSADGSATATWGSKTLSNLTPATRTGYALLGYFTEATNGEKVIDTDGALCASTSWTDGEGAWNKTTANVKFYAHWEIQQFTITFLDINTEITHITQDYGTSITAPANPTKDGYTFVRWEVSIPATMPAQNMEIHAIWQMNSYDVAFDGNGGSGTMLNQTFEYEDSGALSKNRFVWMGYEFTGWNTAANGSGTPYADEQLVMRLSTVNGDVITLYAQWNHIQYTVTFNSDGGTAVNAIQGYYQDPIDASNSIPTREGYSFVRWDPAVPATMPAENITVKAIWAVLPAASEGESVDFVSPEAETVVIDTSVGAIADALADNTKTEVKVEGNGWSMEIPKDIITTANGVVSIGAKTLSAEEKSSLPAEVKDKVVFSLSLTDNNGAVSFTGKKIKVSLPYTLKDGENASDVKVFYLDANNNPVAVDGVTYDATNKCAVFETDHFSNWYVDVIPDDSSSGGGMNIGLIIGIVIGVLVLAGVGAFFFMKSKTA